MSRAASTAIWMTPSMSVWNTTRPAVLERMGLGVPQMTRVFHRLRALGVDIDPSVFTVEQAKAAILDAIARTVPDYQG